MGSQIVSESVPYESHHWLIACDASQNSLTQADAPLGVPTNDDCCRDVLLHVRCPLYNLSF